MKDNKKKKRSAQRDMPCIIPSETLQAYTNQVTQPQPNQPQSLHQPRSTQSIHQPQPHLQPTQSIPQPQSTQSIPKPRPHLQFTHSMARSRSTQSIHQPQPQPQSVQSILKPRPSLQFTQSMARSRSTESKHQPQPQSTQSIPKPRPHLQLTQFMPRSRSTQSIPQPQPHLQSTHIPTQVVHMEEYPIGNAAHSSSSHVSGEDDKTRIQIVPEGDGFDQHKLVVSEIDSIIRTNLEEGMPSWKKVDKDIRDVWFNLFKKRFTWPPECKDKVRRNFEKRGAAKMSQLMQDARQDLDQKPTWMGDKTWGQLKTYWRSSAFKKKSSTNRRNRESLDGASLHTGGSIPHRVHWKRMKQEKGTDPSLVDFYFRTHVKKDKKWVGVHAKAAYKKQELSSQLPTSPLGENEGDSQPQNEMPSDIDLWIHTMGVKKGKSVFGLGSVSEILLPTSSSKLANNDNSEEIASLRSLVHELNASLQRQEEEKLRMKEEQLEMREEFRSLLQYLGFAGSSSRPPSSRPPSSPPSSSHPPSSPLYDHEIVQDSDEVVEDSEGLSDAI